MARHRELLIFGFVMGLLNLVQMGVGIGGDYPLSAVISSEFSSTHIRGRLMTAVFASQGWGNFGMSRRHLASRH
jgi:MFS family permease